MIELLFLLLPLAAASGWWLARRERRAGISARLNHPSFLRGLNSLLDEQPDKAIRHFLELAEVDGETVETHLALGSLFRRRGEVDRAIRIHQNLVARRNLAPEPRSYALLELGQDYMRAGLLDRAEVIFQELAESGMHPQRALLGLRDIYQQERDWSRCLEVAERLRALPEAESIEALHVEIAHYHCELAEEARRQHDGARARRHLSLALASDPHCARATLIEGQAALAEGDTEGALERLLRVAEQRAAYVPEMLPAFIEAVRPRGAAALQRVLADLAARYPNAALTLALAEVVEQRQGVAAALDVLTEYLARHVDLGVLERLLALEAAHAGAECARLRIACEVVHRMAAQRLLYHCEQCGFQARALHWQCPSCKRWGTLVPTRPEPLISDEVMRDSRLA
ncbi:MAG: lipopolysaccharide assembly protein LapB [Chromatiaceae bacterium]|nr:lipopolysaccharide assembly protein LapB [Chromatiaceae bacterium]